MSKYGIEIFDNHVIILTDNKRVLLDTGAPESISDGSSLQIMGQEYRFSSNFLGLSIEKLKELLGTDINILLGADVLKGLNFLVDWDEKEIQFSLNPIPCEGIHVPLEFYMNIPIIALNANGERLKVFLDTGAKLSYFVEEILSRYKPIGRAQDFYPGFGQFTTDIYEITVKINNNSIVIQAGKLPELLQRTLAMTNAKGILGNDIFKYFNVCFNNSEREIIMVKR